MHMFFSHMLNYKIYFVLMATVKSGFIKLVIKYQQKVNHYHDHCHYLR